MQGPGAVRSVEALGEGVLCGLATLDVQQLDLLPLGLLLRCRTDELRGVVPSQAARRTAQFHDPAQHPDHPLRRQIGVDLDSQWFAIEIVVDVKGAEAPPGPQGAGHEVYRPSVGEWLTALECGQADGAFPGMAISASSRRALG